MDFSIKSYYEKYDLYIYRKTDAKYKEEKVKKVNLSRGLGQAENFQKESTFLKWENISIGGYWQVKIKKYHTYYT